MKDILQNISLENILILATYYTLNINKPLNDLISEIEVCISKDLNNGNMSSEKSVNIKWGIDKNDIDPILRQKIQDYANEVGVGGEPSRAADFSNFVIYLLSLEDPLKISMDENYKNFITQQIRENLLIDFIGDSNADYSQFKKYMYNVKAEDLLMKSMKQHFDDFMKSKMSEINKQIPTYSTKGKECITDCKKNNSGCYCYVKPYREGYKLVISNPCPCEKDISDY